MTDGEQRESSFATYPITQTLAGTGLAENLAGDGEPDPHVLLEPVELLLDDLAIAGEPLGQVRPEPTRGGRQYHEDQRGKQAVADAATPFPQGIEAILDPQPRDSEWGGGR